MELTKISFKKNDMVQVIAGKEKGKSGKIVSLSSKSGRVTVEKINMIKRHVRPTQDNPKGGVMEREGTIHISNLRLVNRPKAAKTEKKKKESKGKK
jgi:large subunit ribosomal protein L24